MKNLLTTLLLFVLSVQAYAQDIPERQGVDLPQFVITGQEVITFPPLKKLKPDHISTLSREYINPLFAPEDLIIKEIPSPLNAGHLLFDSAKVYNAGLEAALGNNKLPRIKGYYVLPDGNTLLRIGAGFESTRDYLPKAGRLDAGGSVDFSHFLAEESGFLPNHTLFAEGKYRFGKLNFFGSPSLMEIKRSFSHAGFSMGVREITDRNINYEVKFSDDYLSIPKDDSLTSPGLTENYLGIEGRGKWILPILEIGAEGSLFTQDVSRGDTSYKKNYVKLRGRGFLKPFEEMKAGGGLEYSQFDGISHIHPYIYFSMQINRNFSLFGEFNPSTEFMTIREMTGKNRYTNLNGRGGYFMNRHFSLNAGTKYEYRHYFEISGGAGFFKADNFFFFSDAPGHSKHRGLFEPMSSNANSYNGFAAISIFPNEFGRLFAELRYNRITDTDGNLLPYHPEWSFFAEYAYNFSREFSGSLRTTYFSGAYTDAANNNQLNSVFDFGFRLAYKISDDSEIFLEASNLLGQDIFYLGGYREEQFGIIGGINIRF
ncbi:MAG TPA: TonB-dependent receptor [Ignavibacteriaceae bacterium]|nr:TonB-dependent receptor [Ignavibacteriaceae bacterium]HPO55374.1 TonB-dependent receptor [Ignavibacteriaceae bacterium]